MSVLKPRTYGCKVGDLWVAIDFEAQAVAITKGHPRERSAKTEDLGDGFLIDRNLEGYIISVEVLAGELAAQRLQQQSLFAQEAVSGPCKHRWDFDICLDCYARRPEW